MPILLIALCFPIAYFIYDLILRKKYNFISILGLISVLLTGGIGILEIPTQWFAVKEAAIPSIIGLAVILSLKTPYPLVRSILLNPELMDVPKIDAALLEKISGRLSRAYSALYLLLRFFFFDQCDFELLFSELDCGQPKWDGSVQCGGEQNDALELAGDRHSLLVDHSLHAVDFDQGDPRADGL